MRRRNWIVLISLIAAISLIVGTGFFLLHTSRRPELTVRPLGRATGKYGVQQFMVAITNNTSFTREILVGRTEVFPFGDHYSTNLMGAQLYRLPARSGLEVAVMPPPNPGAWFLGITQKRSIGSMEFQARVLAVDTKVISGTNVFPVWSPIERIEVEK
jgi:hypothetical protein